jgi:hypothetical protein
MPVILDFIPTVSIEKTRLNDTLALCPPFTDSIVADNFSNGAYWSPGNLVSDSTAAALTFTGNMAAWLYLQDTATNQTVDSIYVQPILGSVAIAKANGNLQLFDSVGLSNYTWRLNGVDFLSNNPTLTNPANGVYDLYGNREGCNFTTDTLVVGSANGFAISPGGGSVLPNRQKLNSVYGVQFSVSNGNLVTETFRVNQIYLYGISSTFNKNAFSQATLKLFDSSQNQLYSGTLALQPNSPSVVYLPQINLNEGLDYYLTLSGDTNAYYSMYQSSVTPYQLGSLLGPSGLLEVKNIFKGSNPSNVSNGPAAKLPAFALNFSSTINLPEADKTIFSIYPNPSQDWIEIS